MRKIILILIFMSSLSLNLFGGLVHKDIDTRVQGKFGIGFSNFSAKSPRDKESNALDITPIWVDMAMKTNVYNTEDYSLYLGGEVGLNYKHVFKKDGEKVNNILTTSYNIIGGLEEKYNEDIKFYQQLEVGFSYKMFPYFQNGLRQQTLIRPTLEGALEVGLTYKNVLFSLELEANYNQLPMVYSIGTSLGVGYEF